MNDVSYQKWLEFFKSLDTEDRMQVMSLSRPEATAEIRDIQIAVPKIGDIYGNLVQSNYKMDPETDEYLASSKQLMDGMVVLIADELARVDLARTVVSDHMTNRALTFNRWCTVSNVHPLNESVTLFVGAYEDGTKRNRVAPNDSAWLVKINSLPELQDPTQHPKYEAIRELVKEAMTQHGKSSENPFLWNTHAEASLLAEKIIEVL